MKSTKLRRYEFSKIDSRKPHFELNVLISRNFLKAAEEEEAKTMTLDEWKAQQTASRDKPTFNVRKAGEGSDIDPKWKKTYAYKKEKETHEDDDEEVRKK